MQSFRINREIEMLCIILFSHRNRSLSRFSGRNFFASLQSTTFAGRSFELSWYLLHVDSFRVLNLNNPWEPYISTVSEASLWGLRLRGFYHLHLGIKHPCQGLIYINQTKPTQTAHGKIYSEIQWLKLISNKLSIRLSSLQKWIPTQNFIFWLKILFKFTIWL